MVFRFGISISHEWTPAFVELYRTLRLPQHIYQLLRYAIFMLSSFLFLKSRQLKVPAHFSLFRDEAPDARANLDGALQIGAARS